MAVSVSLSNLNNGDQIAIPYTVNGTTTLSGGATSVVAMSYQMNNGTRKPIMPPYGSFSFTISTTDCPTVGASYTLTVWADDNMGGTDHPSFNFTRSS
jgi:hypothetical protein